LIISNGKQIDLHSGGILQPAISGGLQSPRSHARAWERGFQGLCSPPTGYMGCIDFESPK
jgi:hypothetical protein